MLVKQPIQMASCILFLAFSLANAAVAEDKPRLILQITVDQLRGDLPFRHYDQFGPGGFRYLMDQGVYFDNAHHAHANTETVVGHTTLANRMLRSFGCPIPIEMVRIKYLNNMVEQDHRIIKKRIRPMLGFKSFVSASATLERIEVANMIRKMQITPGLCPFAQFAALAV
ncbi:DDE-type integrase/transposase/recombinase [Ruegeria pomeroyi]|nr:DDE-type integrase/transposase/recombinase [Ruegeria pomeroyi]